MLKTSCFSLNHLLVYQVFGCIQLPQSKFVVVFVIQDVQQVSEEGMNFLVDIEVEKCVRHDNEMISH